MLKKYFWILVICMILITSSSLALTGSGTADSPWLVSTEAELLEAFGKDGYIKLAANITLTQEQTITRAAADYPTALCNLYVKKGQSVVLDLGGHKLTYSNAPAKDFGVIINDGTLVVKDSGTNGKISYQYTNPQGKYSKIFATILNGGKLTVESGCIENTTAYGEVSPAIENNTKWSYFNEQNAECVINGGTLLSNGYRAVRMYAHYYSGYNNAVTVNGGKITGDGGIYMQYGDLWYYPDPSSNRQAKGELIINGGTIGLKDGSTRKTAVYYTLSTPENKDWKVSITGGTINGEMEFDVYRGYSTTGAGPEPSGSRVDEWLQENGGIISGGKFSKPFDEKFIKQGVDSFTFVNGFFQIGAAAEVPAATGSHSAPKTGDNTPVMLLAALLVVSVLGMGFMRRKVCR